MNIGLPVLAGADDSTGDHTVARSARGPARVGCRARRSLQVLALAAGLACAGSGAATEPATEPGQSATTATARPSPLPSVEDIIGRNTVARGGRKAWRAVNTLSEFGHMEVAKINALAGGPQARRRTSGTAPRESALPFTMHMKRPHKLHLEIQYQGATAIQVFDGTQGWTILPSPKGPVATPFPPGAALAAAMQQDLDGPLIDSAAKGVQVALDGTEPVDGREAYRLKLTLRDGQVRHLWVDAESFLDTKIDGTRIIGGKAWPVETYFSAYKKVHGLSIPHALETTVAGVRSTERIVIDRVVLNPVLDDSVFAPPFPERTP